MKNITLLSTMFTFVLTAMTVVARPVKVFILAGQSNMEGQAVVDLEGKDYNDGRGTLAALMRDPAKSAMLRHLHDAQGKWTVREDVCVRYQRERGPLLAGGVEFTDVKNVEAETKRMPNFTLHELAHGYHDRVLARGFDHAEIKAAFERAKASQSYDRVERWFGNGRANTEEKAYAMTNPMEYFAETTEAFFSRNDFFPFTRDELNRHDPAMEKLLAELWGVTK